ncbi:MAG: tetratricopeptide repeat protein [Candidatus Hodarchaeales archaeon]
MGNLNEAISQADSIIEKGRKQNNPYFVIDAHLLEAQVYWIQGKYKISSENIGRAEKIIFKLSRDEESERREAWVNIGRGHISWSQTNYDRALEYFRESLSIGNRINCPECVAESLADIGAIYALRGSFTQGLKSFKTSYDIFKEIGDKLAIAEVSTNLGFIYWRQGELDLALEWVELGLHIFEEMGDKNRIAASLETLGKIYYQKNEDTKALENLIAARDLFKVGGNRSFISKPIFQIILIKIDNKDFEQAKDFFKELKELSSKKPNKAMKHQLQMAEALLAKNVSRVSNLAKTEAILRKIIEDDMVDNQITTMAIVHLCEIRLFELRATSGDPVILQEIQDYINRLLEIASNQNVATLLVQTFLLQSKMAIIQRNNSFARKLLRQSQELAEEKGLNKLAIQISNEYDSLLSSIGTLDEIEEKEESTLLERVESVKIENTLNRMINPKEVVVSEEISETPILLLIIHEGSGLGVYTKEFSMRKHKGQLISGIITAINSLLKDAFSIAGTLERIQYKDFRVVIREDSPLLFVYVFRGHSYYPLKKLQTFIELVKTAKDQWKTFCSIVDEGQLLSDKDKAIIDEYADKSFISNQHVGTEKR